MNRFQVIVMVQPHVCSYIHSRCGLVWDLKCPEADTAGKNKDLNQRIAG